MPRICPNCAAAIPRIRGVEVRESRPKGASWYRWAPRHYYCHSCDTELCTKTRPAGFVFFALMCLLVPASFLGMSGTVPWLWRGPIPVLAAMVILATLYTLWGFALVLPRHPSNNRIERTREP